jgi:hypothetical protein
MLVSTVGTGRKRIAVPTTLGELLSQPGLVTCDDYFRFFARAFTAPSPAFEGWRRDEQFRYPLLFALKYLLAKRIISVSSVTTLDEIIGAYLETQFVGDEVVESFIRIAGNDERYGDLGRTFPKDQRRQARESLQVICQVSYLYLDGRNVFVSLSRDEARGEFEHLVPVPGPRAADPEAEIRRVADGFRVGGPKETVDYPEAGNREIILSGFTEGSRVKKTHITIERNSGLRTAFFTANPAPICDVCALDTALTYPWTTRILDIHHLLPLASGTRVVSFGRRKGQARTTFEDLVPICPNCHRAVHRFYDTWLENQGLNDFPNEALARDAYRTMKAQFRGAVYV